MKRERILGANQYTRPWTEKDEILLGTMRDTELAEKIGRSVGAVTQKRLAMGIAAFVPRSYTWSRAEIALLGRKSDADVAFEIGVSRKCVVEARLRRGICCFSPRNQPRKYRKRHVVVLS